MLLYILAMRLPRYLHTDGHLHTDVTAEKMAARELGRVKLGFPAPIILI
jgi:hypothetical protein